ncbi:MAG: Ku protein [Dermatophilus congolensis]|nr:Ku protein [Dermatophilus congolensis]
MRSIWTGAISFGLVNVPVKVYSATEDHDVSLHQVHGADGGRIRYQRRCEVCDEIVEYADIQRAYDDGERTVVLTDDDLDSLPSEKSKEIEVVQFVPADQIDPLLHDRSYYLASDAKSPKAYSLLCKTLDSTSLVAVVKFALRQRTRLGMLSVRDGVLVLQSLLWPDEIREADFEPATAKVSQQELKMSKTLVESYTTDFTPEEFTDEYQDELRKLIDAKLEQGDALDTAATFGEDSRASGEGEVVDLMTALKNSLERKRSGGGSGGSGTSDDADAPQKAQKTQKAQKPKAGEKSGKKAPSTPTTRKPGKAAGAKKSAAKQSTAEKTGTKKSSGASKSA